MRTNQAGIDLVKSFEGLRLTAYQDVRGIWTIGYGTTGPWVHRGLTISPMEAEEKLKDHMLYTEKFVAKQIGEAPTTPGNSVLWSRLHTMWAWVISRNPRCLSTTEVVRP